MTQPNTNRPDFVEEKFERQQECWQQVRERLQTAVTFYVHEKGHVTVPAHHQDVLALVQALEIATRNERQVLLDLNSLKSTIG